MKSNRFSFARIACYIVFLLFFAIIPVDAVLNGPPLCTLNSLTGFLCPTCGFTRGFTLFMHLRLEEAFFYNPVLTSFIAPATLLTAFQDTIVVLYRALSKKDATSFFEYLLICIWK